MKIRTKILLSAMMVSLIALIFTPSIHHEDIKIEPIGAQNCIPQNTVEIRQIEKEDVNKSINFEIDKAVEEMNQKMAEIESIEDKKEWFLAYKSIIDEYSYILDPPETIYDYFTEEELDLLFHVVQAEVGDEYSFEQKVNVAGVIFNRWEHERFPDTLLEILTPDQFQPIANGSYKNVEVSEDTVLACEYAFQVGTDTEKCLFFDSNDTLDYEPVWNDGAHNFYKYREEK